MKALLVLLLLSLTACPAHTNKATKDKDCEKNPRDCFGDFEDDGEIHTNSGNAERTFSFPPVKAGFLFDFYHRDLLPQIGLEVKAFTVFGQDFAWDTGAATSRAYTSLTWELLPIIKVGPSIWVGYNVREDSPAFGLGFTMLDF